MRSPLLVLLRDGSHKSRGLVLLESAAKEVHGTVKTYALDRVTYPEPEWRESLCLFFIDAPPKQAAHCIRKIAEVDSAAQAVVLVFSGDLRERRQQITYCGAGLGHWVAWNPAAEGFKAQVVCWIETIRQRRAFQSTLDRVQMQVRAAPSVSSGEVRRLLLTEQHFGTILRNAREAIVSTDSSGRILFCNRAAARLFQVDEQRIVGTHLKKLAPGDWEAYFSRLEQGTLLLPGEAELKMFLGREERCLHVKYDAIRQEGSLPSIGVTILAQDVTLAKKQAKALEAQQRKLRSALTRAKAANRARDRFLAALSHELRTPLMPIGMTLSSLKRMEQLPAKAKKALSVIDRNLQIQVKLIDDLLDLSRAIKESRDPQHRERVNIHEVFASAKEVCMADLRRKKQTVETREEARVPFVQGDRARLQQVFWNLLRNASKFSPEGATISASFSNQNGNVIFQMADPGIGIPRPLLGKIFNLYEQGGSKEGLGLGLWISRTIVNAHGGTIRARSRGPGQGATFIIILPCSPGSKKSSLRAGTNRQQP